MTRKIVIIGSSIAGISAAEAARKQDPDAKILILSHDHLMPYYRLRICEVLENSELGGNLFLHPDSWYAQRDLTIRLCQQVVSVDPIIKQVHLENGTCESYDSLVIASGSQSFIPPVQGIGRPGVHSLWTLQNAIDVERELPSCHNVIVIGGGLLGLEAAYYARKAGKQVTVIERLSRLLANQLDEAGSAVFKKRVEGLGITVLTSADTKQIHGLTADHASPVREVQLADGRHLAADMVLVCIGVRANVGFLDNSGIAVGNRISADERLETSSSDVFAAGDVAEPEGCWYGLWAIAKAQGQVAGCNAAGGDLGFKQTIPPYVINTMGTRVVAMGDKGIADDPHYHLEISLDESGGNYRKLIYRDRILSGFMLIGETSEFISLQKQIGIQHLN